MRNPTLSPAIATLSLSFTCLAMVLIESLSAIGLDVLSIYPHLVILILLITIVYHCLETSHERVA